MLLKKKKKKKRQRKQTGQSISILAQDGSSSVTVMYTFSLTVTLSSSGDIRPLSPIILQTSITAILKSTFLILPPPKYPALHFVPPSVNQRGSGSIKAFWSQITQRNTPIAGQDCAVLKYNEYLWEDHIFKVFYHLAGTVWITFQIKI